MSSLIHKINRKIITILAGFFLMYVGVALLFLPMIVSFGFISLSDEPQFFGFEDDLEKVNSIQGTPVVVTSPIVGGKGAVECQNHDYVRWNLNPPSKTLDLVFKILWTKLPTKINQSLIIGEILGIDYSGSWQDIFSTNLFCDLTGYRNWCLWTGIPTGHDKCISSDIVYKLETNRWYSIRMTADLNTGTYRLYLDGILLASLTDILVPADVYIDFFRLGAAVRGEGEFIIYYDDVVASFLDPTPDDNQWSLRITSSLGGETNPSGKLNFMYGDNSTANAIPVPGYIFDVWILDGENYSKSPMVTILPQTLGTQHTLHAIFKSTNPEFILKDNWIPFQAIGLAMVVSGGYILWLYKKQKPP